MVALAIVRISAGRGRRPHLRGRLGRVDNFVLLSFEAMARNFVGIHLRTMSMWSGGIYFMALLVSADRSRKQAAQLRAQALWPRILRFEALLQADHVPQEVRDFDAHFLWVSSPIYRELLALVAHGHLAAAQQLSINFKSFVVEQRQQIAPLSAGSIRHNATIIFPLVGSHKRIHRYNASLEVLG